MFAPEGDGCLQRAKREDAGRFSKEGKSLDDFCRAFGHSKARERKSFFMLKITPHPPLSRSPFCPCLGDADRVCFANRSIPRWRRLSIRFFFCKIRRKRKSYQKENAEISFRALRSATRATRAPVSATPTHMLRICVNPPTAQASPKA